jgi:LysM repeat protein
MRLFAVSLVVLSVISCGAACGDDDTTGVVVQTVPAASRTSHVATVAATPGTAGSTTASSRTYTVQSGDTLFSIAQQFNTTVAILTNINGLAKSNAIVAGQVLKLP